MTLQGHGLDGSFTGGTSCGTIRTNKVATALEGTRPWQTHARGPSRHPDQERVAACRRIAGPHRTQSPLVTILHLITGGPEPAVVCRNEGIFRGAPQLFPASTFGD
jgi:hypothetical protein